MESTQELAKRIDAPFMSLQARRKQSPFRFTWLLVSLIVLATATSSGYAQVWRYHAKKSREYHPKKSWKYHPKNSWTYHPKTSSKYHPNKSWKYHRWQKRRRPIVRRRIRKNDYRITSTPPLIGQLVARVSGDRERDRDSVTVASPCARAGATATGSRA